jgi:wyosine [tRNA(Phe)-imidazoG37] synthetase (radical SAM superfamily)
MVQNKTNHNTESNEQQYVYGPVPSRRLGRSLGVDMVPFKTCTYDCIYCQLGRTTSKITHRKEWIPSNTIIAQVKNRLASNPDCITISGSGEPTLHSKIGEVIVGIKKISDIPIAVLTNGSLLWLPEVRNSLKEADLVLPSLDAGSESLYRYVNRPHPGIPFGKMLEGLVKFRDEYVGKYWLEILLLSGVTTVEAQVNALAHAIKLIIPDKVHVHTVSRPPVEDFATAVSKEQLKEIASKLSSKAEIITGSRTNREQCENSVRSQDILELLRRRPCSVEDITLGLGSHRNAVVKCLEQLCSQKQARVEYTTQGVFYKALNQFREQEGNRKWN